MSSHRLSGVLGAVAERRLPRVRAAAYRLAERTAIAWFHRFYYLDMERTWENTRWLGHRIQKFPGDVWVYQEILTELRPDWIIETGTNWGGSAYYLASICDLLGNGRVVTVDLDAKPDPPQHERITYLAGSSTAPEIVERVRGMIDGSQTVLVILDSDHSYEHVSDELRVYCELVTPGSYLIVEDTNIAGHPVLRGLPRGPYEAVDDFLAGDERFERDRTREKFMMTFNPGGYLKRIDR
ncbi:MAG TPA: CmcI family methyltransferase [Solirubrobacteraceae bacterium]|nr:CmcI family methyltransferase [Solirubrobacteraceae bacterium]